MAYLRMLTPETSPEPELRATGGLWQSKPAITTATTASQSLQKRKRSWPFTTTRPVSPPSSSYPSSGGEQPSSSTSVKALWENGWRTATKRGMAPFQDAHYEDLQPIFDTLIESGTDDITSADYTLAFYPRAHELALRAENALLHHGNAALAAELYLRASAVLRAARYSPPPPTSSCLPGAAPPTPSHPTCPVRARAWQLQKSYHTRAGRLWPDSPLDEVTIPHTHDVATRPEPNSSSSSGVRDRGGKDARSTGAGPARPQIPLAVRLPLRTLRTGGPCPAVLVVTDDRTAHSALCGDLLSRGWGCVVIEAPGCGDCPVPIPAQQSSSSPSEGGGDSTASAQAEALWASVLEWMGAIRVFDMARVVVWAAAAPAAGGVVVDDGPRMVVGQSFTAAAATVPGARVRGCVAVVGGGSPAVLGAAAGGNGSGDDADTGVEMASGPEGLWTPAAACDGDGCRERDDGLVLFEYGASGTGAETALRSLTASPAAVYDWVEDLLRLDLAA